MRRDVPVGRNLIVLFLLLGELCIVFLGLLAASAKVGEYRHFDKVFCVSAKGGGWRRDLEGSEQWLAGSLLGVVTGWQLLTPTKPYRADSSI